MRPTTITSADLDKREHRNRITCMVSDDNTVDRLLDQWFEFNGVVSMKIKSRAWVLLSEKREQLYIKRLQELLALNGVSKANIKFSIYAGCKQCPCSKGFLIEVLETTGHLVFQRPGKTALDMWWDAIGTIWVDVAFTDDDVHEMESTINSIGPLIDVDKALEKIQAGLIEAGISRLTWQLSDRK